LEDCAPHLRGASVAAGLVVQERCPTSHRADRIERPQQETPFDDHVERRFSLQALAG
jgi:hypothetical protein